MNSKIHTNHWHDSNGNPSGGCSFGNGFTISWQNGPLGRGDERLEPNGAFVEDVINAAADRLLFYQQGKFSCTTNEIALDHLRAALVQLNARTKEREQRAVEGTHTV